MGKSKKAKSKKAKSSGISVWVILFVIVIVVIVVLITTTPEGLGPVSAQLKVVQKQVKDLMGLEASTATTIATGTGLTRTETVTNLVTDSVPTQTLPSATVPPATTLPPPPPATTLPPPPTTTLPPSPVTTLPPPPATTLPPPPATTLPPPPPATTLPPPPATTLPPPPATTLPPPPATTLPPPPPATTLPPPPATTLPPPPPATTLPPPPATTLPPPPATTLPPPPPVTTLPPPPATTLPPPSPPPVPTLPPLLPVHDVVQIDTGSGEKEVLFYRDAEESKTNNKGNLLLNPERPFEKLIRPSWEKPDMAAYKGPFNLVKKPNLVFFTHKFTRAGDVGPYKAEDHPAKTPTWNKLAEDGIAFMRAYSQMANFASSLDALMFGKEPDSTGSYDFQSTYNSSREYLPNLLKKQGYEVFVVGVAIWKSPKTPNIRSYGSNLREAESTIRSSWVKNAEDGFDKKDIGTMVCKGGPSSDIPRKGMEEWDGAVDYKTLNTDTRKYKTSLDGEYVCAEELKLKEVLDWLSTLKKGQPWALIYSIDASRGPYRTPYHFYQNLKTGLPQDAVFDFYPDAKMVKQPPVVDNIAKNIPYNFSFYNCKANESLVEKEDAVAMRADYYATVQYGDWLMGRVMEEVDRLGERANTMFVATSNQGSMMGERGQSCGFSVLESVTRVPLVISYPGLPLNRRGQKCWELVEQIDVVPTILEMLSLPFEDTNRKPRPLQLDGRSLVPLFRNLCTDFREVARSQYVRCVEKQGRNLKKELIENDEKQKRTNSCTGTGRNKYGAFHLVGYSVRSKDFRMNVWMANPR